MAKSVDDLAAALMKAGVKSKPDAIAIATKFAKGTSNFDALLKSIKSSGAVFDNKLMRQIADASSDPKTFARLTSRSQLVLGRAIRTIKAAGGDISPILTKKGKLIKGDFTPDEIAKIFNKSTDDIAKMADDVEVQNAAKMKKKDLIKLGISGSLVAGVIFLMLVTGKSNPVKAIAEALKAAAAAAADTGSDIFKELFSGMGGFFNVSALFLFCSSVGLVIWLVLSVVLKK